MKIYNMWKYLDLQSPLIYTLVYDQDEHVILGSFYLYYETHNDLKLSKTCLQEQNVNQTLLMEKDAYMEL